MSRIYCWDASVFLAWLNGGENRPSEKLANLRAAVDDIDKGRAMLITPSTVSTEVWESRIPDEEKRNWYINVFKRENVQKIQVSDPIAKIAGQLREECKVAGVSLTTEDALYLATGIVYKADEIHSFDADFLRVNGLLQSVSVPIVEPRGMELQLPLTGGGQVIKADQEGAVNDSA